MIYCVNMKNYIKTGLLLMLGALFLINLTIMSSLRENAHQIKTQGTKTSDLPVELLQAEEEFVGPYVIYQKPMEQEVNVYNLLSGENWMYNDSDYGLLDTDYFDWTLAEEDSSVLIYHIYSNTLKKIRLNDGEIVWQQFILDSIETSYTVSIDAHKDLACLRFDTEMSYSVCRFFDLEDGKEKFAVKQNLYYYPAAHDEEAFRDTLKQITDYKQAYFFEEQQLLFDQAKVKLYALGEYEKVFIGKEGVVATKSKQVDFPHLNSVAYFKKHEEALVEMQFLSKGRKVGLAESVSDKYIFYGKETCFYLDYNYSKYHFLLYPFGVAALPDEVHKWRYLCTNGKLLVGAKHNALGIYDIEENWVCYLAEPPSQGIHQVHIGESNIFALTLSRRQLDEASSSDRIMVYTVPLDFMHAPPNVSNTFNFYEE